MVKCDIKGCSKPMAVMHPTNERTDGGLFENVTTKRAYHICTACIETLGLKEKEKKKA